MTKQEIKAGARTDVCAGCGADVRPDSLFCYNCGGSLDETALQEIKEPKSTPADASANGSSGENSIKAGPGLRSAAAIRKEPKGFQRKPIQIAWEPAEGESNFLLVLTAVIILVFALGAAALALYYK